MRVWLVVALVAALAWRAYGQSASCNGGVTGFETSFQGYTQSTTDDFDWTRQNTGTSSSSTGPSTGKPGYYIYTETSSPRVLGDRATISSPSYATPASDACQVNFWYHMYGASVGSLLVNVTDASGVNRNIFTRTGDSKINAWLNTGVAVKPSYFTSKTFKLTFTGVRGASYTGDIAVDTISWSTACCLKISSPCGQEAVTFNNGLRGWTNSKNDKFDWTLDSSGTSSGSTGPSQDVTPNSPFGNGNYLYTEASSPRQVNDSAIFNSPHFAKPATPKSCQFNFWYHSYGSTTGSLNLDLLKSPTAPTPPLPTRVFSIKNVNADKWVFKSVSLSSVTTDFQLRFTGLRGSSFTGDIAIDQLYFTGCCAVQPCVIRPITFDRSSNGFYTQQVLGSATSIVWKRNYGSTSSSSTGPSADHTLGNNTGHYYYLETSGASTGAKNWLVSPLYTKPRTTTGTIRFWYHMYGASVGTLNVYVVPSTFTLTSTSTLPGRVWTKSGNQGNVWTVATASLKMTSSFYIIFEGVRGTSFTGDIAIDDVSFDSNCCTDWSKLSTTAIKSTFAVGTLVTRGKDWSWGLQDGGKGSQGNVTSVLTSANWVGIKWSNGHSNTYRMGSGSKYDVYLFNDASTTVPSVKACTMNTAFTTSVAPWVDSKGDKVDWTRRSGGTPSSSTGPSGDHTTGSGFYMYLETSSPVGIGDNAILLTPVLSQVDQDCSFTLWYNMNGATIGSLIIRLTSVASATVTSLFTKKGNQGTSWLQTPKLPIKKSQGQFQIAIEGIGGSSFTGDIAIDDIVFDSSCCGAVCIPKNTFGSTTSSSFGGWSNSKDDQQDWRLQNGGTSSSSTGPSADHTGGGYYVYYETSSPVSSGHQAKLLSPQILPSKSSAGCTFSFFYHMYGSTIGKLELFVQTDILWMSAASVWSKSGNQGNAWLSATATVKQTAWVYRLMFVGTRGSSFTGDIALDDMTFGTNCGCFACSTLRDFESKAAIASLVQSKTDNLDWTVHQSSTSSSSTGPTTDHTLGTSLGSYIYLETSSPVVAGQNAVISMPLAGPALGPKCSVVFWYHMYGSTIGTLNVRRFVGTTNTIIWTKKGNQGNRWIRGVVPLGTTSSFTAAFEAIAGSSFTGDIALDDIWLTQDCCAARPVWSQYTVAQITSSFRQNVRVIRGLHWSWGSQGNNTAGTVVQGLRNYTSTGWLRVRWDDGHLNSYRMGASSKYDLYLQIPQQPVQAPTPTTPAPTPTAAPIFGYCYNWATYSTAQLTLIFSVTTRVTRGTDWQWGAQNGGTNGTIIATLGQTTTGWVRVTWDNGHTNSYRMGASGKYDLCLERNTTVTTEPPTAPTACGFMNNFEVGFNNFTQDQLDKFDWSRQRGSTSSSSTGPSGDHTTGSGYYVYIETSSPRTNGDVARLYSPFFDSKTLTCGFTFWYNMYGSTINTLKVSIQSGGKIRQVWTLSGNQGNRWIQTKSIPIKFVGIFRVIFEGVAGSSFTGDIAIDDFQFTSTCCAQSSCGAPTATFNSGLDGFKQESGDHFDWTRQSGGTTSSSTGPITGHGGNGSYMYIETSFPRSAGDVAILTSSIYSITQPTCEYGFWYHMYGSTIGTLSVIVAEAGSSTNTTIWTKTGAQGNAWIFGRAKLPASMAGKTVQIKFMAVAGTSFTGDIAIDDVGFLDGCCRVAKACGFSPVTFQTGLEGFTQDVTDDMQWTRRNGRTPSFQTGPTVDHTYANGTGYYVYIETSGTSSGRKARLISRPISSSTTVCSVNFWYHMYGATVNTLNVYINSSSTGMKRVWTISGNQGNIWKRQTLFVNQSTEFFLVFEAITGTSFTGDIALDDITFNQDCCGVYCSESYKPFGAFQMSIIFAKNTRVTRGTAWTYANQDGGWGYQGTIMSSPPTSAFGPVQVLWDNGKTYSYQVGVSGQFDLCRSVPLPYYTGYSPAEVQQLLYQNVTVFRGRDWKWQNQDGLNTGVVTVNMSIHNNIGWVRVYFPFATGNQENSYRMGAEGAFDLFRVCDVDLSKTCVGKLRPGLTTPTPTPTIPAPPGIDMCTSPTQDFEQGFGGYTQDPADQFDWLRHQGSTSSLNTGPSIDHTLGTSAGYYTYIETSSPRSPGDTANLWSPWYKAPTQTCSYSFWYHMYGSTTGSLNVTIVTSTGRIAAWSMAGNQGTAWKQGIIPVLTSYGTFRIIFSGTRGGSFTGDIALDDLAFGKDCCRGCNNSPITFETGLQKFTQSKTDDFDWTLNTGSTPSFSTGPGTDHTLGTTAGGYMYIETSFPRSSGDVAVLVSPKYSAPPGFTCSFQFFYSMYGTTIGNLSVIIRSVTPSGTSDSLAWSLAGNQGQGWNPATVNVAYGTPDYQVVFRATCGTSFTGDIAIDDISFTGGCCASCNGPSTFESGLGIWSQSKTDSLDWTRKQGPTASTATGPPLDHTPGVTNGYYMYTESSFPARAGDTALLMSPVFSSPLEVGCQMDFWYHMYGSAQGTLDVLIRLDGVRNHTVFTKSGDQGTAWRQGKIAIAIGTFNKDIQIWIRATIGTSYTSDIAVDDISFTSQCCPATCLQPNNFENSVAPYILGPSGVFNWTRSGGSTGSTGTGPTSDHTIGNSIGKYLYIETSLPRKAGDKAYLTSPVFRGASGGCAVIFWYHMYGATIGSLQATIWSNGKAVASWTKSGNQGNSWQSASLAVPAGTTTFMVQWIGTSGTSYTGDIALDDISYSRQCCSQTPKLPNYATTPISILQDRFKNGTLVVRGKDWIWGTQDVGVVGTVIRPLDISGTVQVQWDDGSIGTYSMGSGGRFELYNLQDIGGAIAPTTGGGTVYDTSKCPVYSVYTKRQLVDLFKAGTRVVRGANWKWGSQDGGAGRPGTITVGYTSLFTLVTVVWDSDNSTNYRYTIDGTTFDLCRVNDIQNGPATVWPPSTSTPALVCPDYSKLSSAQIAFAFSNNTAVVRGKDWSYGTQDGGASGVTISHVLGGQVQVMWVGGKAYTYNLGSSGKYDLCRVQDVGKTTIIVVLPTTATPAVCGNPVTFESGLQGFTDTVGAFTWTRNSGGTSSFATGPSADHTFGNPKGYYMYIETSSPRRTSDTARMLSPLYPVPPTKHCQVSFWYHMYGTTVGTLNVYVTQSGKPDVLLFNRTGQLGNYWAQAILNVSQVVTGNYQIKFEGIAGTSFTGDIGIDDVFQGTGCCSSSLPQYGIIAPFWGQLAALFPIGTRVVRGRDWAWGSQDGGPGGQGTVTRTVTAGTPTIQVKWDNGNSYAYRMGNGKYDLYRLTDLYSGIQPTVPATTLPPVRPADQACSRRDDFQQDFGGFKQPTTDTFDWTRQRGQTSSFATGPDVDHTLGTAAGYYVYIETSSPRVTGDYATLQSPWYASPPTNSCRVNFYYHMYGADIGSLNITLKTRTGTTINKNLVFYKAGDNLDKWEFGSFPVPAHSPAFQVEFVGVVGSSFGGDIALDDISLSDGCCQGHPDYSTYGTAQISSIFKVGTRVVRGKDWSWGDQDKHGLGTVIGGLTAGGWVRVTWDSGFTSNYRMGYNALYDLWLAVITGCEDLVAPSNGQMTGTSSLFGAKTTFSCNTGFFLQGSQARQCLTSGGWSGSTAICLTKLPTWSQYTSAELAVIFAIGTRVIRGVDWSYGLQDGNGPGTVESSLNRTTGMLLVKWDSNGQTYPYRMGQPSNKYDLVLYKRTTCAALVVPGNGAISSTATAFGTTVTYTCVSGYQLQGPTTRTCQDPGFWDKLTPKCVQNCNGTQYQCAQGSCVSTTTRCNGITFECPDNSDELMCPTTPSPALCTAGQFACKSGFTCIPQAQRCNGIYWDCGDGSDEAQCTVVSSTVPPPAYAPLNGSDLAAKFPIGAVVVRGKDWSYGAQDGFGTGKVTSALSGGFIDVTWDWLPFSFTYRMGAGGKYDLYLVSDLPTSHCPTPVEPLHGYTSSGSNPRQFGSVVTYHCKPGYSIQGAAHSLCLGDGSWTSIAPTCIRDVNGTIGIDYSLLTDSEVQALFTVGVRVVRGQDWIYGSQDGGVGGVGTVSQALSFGTVGVQWDIRPATTYFYRMGYFQDKYDLTLFKATRCIPVSKPLNGYLQTSSSNYTIGTTVVFGCYAPYSVQGSTLLTCQKNGVWRGTQPICTQSISPCALGQIRCLQSSTCIPRSAECDGVFNCPDQSDEIYCSNSTAQDCTGLGAPLNGYIKANSTAFGATILYQCYDPYVYQGVVRRTCQVDGTWDGQAGVCTLPYKQCKYYEQRCGDGVTCIDKTKVCNNYPDCPDASDEIGCTVANITTVAPGQLCPSLSSPPHGYIQGNATNKFGYVAFSCNPPYVLQGSSVRTCQDDGTWSGFPAYCSLNVASCKTGFLPCLTTQTCYAAVRQCDGINDCTDASDEAHCNTTASGCPPIAKPVHGNIQGASTASGAILVFSCTAMYQLQGPLSIQCRNGAWNQLPPTCIHPTICTASTNVKCLNQVGCVIPSQICDGVPNCADGSDEATCANGSAGTGPACPVLTPPANGMLQGSSRAYMANMIVTCNTPYTLQGSTVRICQINKQWSGSDGVCKTYVKGCQPNQVRCYDGTECIAASARCDGIHFDCLDDSDEANCPTSPVPITIEPTTKPVVVPTTTPRFVIVTQSDGSTKLVPVTAPPSRCFSGYCSNGGTCVDNGPDRSLVCSCTPQYTGSNCQDPVDGAAATTETIDKPTRGVEAQSSTSGDNQLYYILIGVFGGVLLLIVVLVAAYILLTSKNRGSQTRRPNQPPMSALSIQSPDGFRGEEFALGDDQLGMSNPMYDETGAAGGFGGDQLGQSELAGDPLYEPVPAMQPRV